MSIEIRDGEFFSMLGPSGCGKTTTLRMIAGFELPTEGDVTIHGKPMGRTPPFQRPVNTVFQSYALFPHMTIGENVAFGLQMKGIAKPEIERRVHEALEMVRLPNFAKRRPRQLSGGQQQRVALARALVNRPEVLLLDEPLGALDQKLRKEMQIELKKLQREVGITFIFVTHDQEEALTMSDRIAVMSHGVVLQCASSAEIYERPNCKFVADFIGESCFLDGTVLDLQGNEAKVALEGGITVRSQIAHPVSKGAKVTVAIRPEKIDFYTTDSSRIGSDPNLFEGRVTSVVYIGTDTQYGVQLAGGQSMRVRMQNDLPGSKPVAVEGDLVKIGFSVDAARVLTE
ncbi:MAG: ABC transporter ATP-binding protein [Caldilineaceae bacterium]